jgi:signal transduction histidine kinase
MIDSTQNIHSDTPNNGSVIALNSTLKPIRFSVDSALLRELGERLVGKPHIALAELIKNSYDADATQVVIKFDRDSIEISDNGHGMNFEEFSKFWMRIGSPHKQEKLLSRDFKRPLTGSKGVGRLAVQFLAHRFEMITTSKENTFTEIFARVDWDEAVVASELTNAQALYVERPANTEIMHGSSCGTKLILSGLKQHWSASEFKELAQEIWSLQPPFRGYSISETSTPEYDNDKSFRVVLESPNKSEVDSFNRQMSAFLALYHARLVGNLITVGSDNDKERKVQLSLEFRGGATFKEEYALPECNLNALVFEIRVYYLDGRQQFGIKVDDARRYLRNFGGVHVYDAGFHLPYYGGETDWLRVEIDHSHRMFRSQLLPDELQDRENEGLRFLPTNGRLFGVVRVNTSKERDAWEKYHQEEDEYLAISVTRDRLLNNSAFDCLRDTVRWALDYYAVQEAKRNAEQKLARRAVQRLDPIPERFQQIDDVLDKHRADIPAPLIEDIRTRVQEAIQVRTEEAQAMSERLGLLGALATAGISALAYEHEVGRQFQVMDSISAQLLRLDNTETNVKDRVVELAEQLKACVARARSTRALFSHLMDEDNRNMRDRFKAKSLINQVGEQMTVLLRGIHVDTSGVDNGLRLPEAGFAEWSAVFQNVLLNAVNAMLDAPQRNIAVASYTEGTRRAIVIQDTGTGVSLASAEELFKPFVRKTKLSRERQSLGMGGTGLGLTIVRMIANSIHCKVSFRIPSPGFNTAFEISWSEEA